MIEKKIARPYVFRLLGSVYEKKAGEAEAHPTVINIEIMAENEADAERQVGGALGKLVEKVEAELRRMKWALVDRSSEAQTAKSSNQIKIRPQAQEKWPVQGGSSDFFEHWRQNTEDKNKI